MSNSQHLLVAVFLMFVIVVAGGAVFVVPTYRKASDARTKVANLREKVTGLSGQTEVVEQLAGEVAAVRTHVEEDLKTIPPTPDIAELMRKLSLPVDGVVVQDQTFTAGSPGEAVIGRETAAEAMPLTVEMLARFDSVFATIRAAEAMPRLVRVASVRLEAEGDGGRGDSPMLDASVRLEAIYGTIDGEEAP